MIGTQLGPYQIVAKLGEGGMGEVWRARDTKLDRDVAIKVLPEVFAHDADRLARFTREAKTLASLNHPNIAQIHGLEESGGVTALVMELVDGDDLSQRIARGAIPLDEALPIARQIAEALEAAHEQGIIHRDLKPANIKVRADGTVKVLDFGLAKLGPHQASGSRLQALGVPGDESPTITSPAMTQAGMILGTAAYMSPEQARGKAVDRRADIWAFGCVLYEMLTGRRAFGGENVTDTLAAVVRAEPTWTLLPAGLSPTLVSFLKSCLHKDAKQRLPDIAAMRLALDGAFETVTPDTASSVSSRAVRRTRLAWAVAGASALVALTLASLMLRPRPQPERPAVVRYELRSPEGTTRFGHNVAARGTQPPAPHFAVSPDGRKLAFVAITENVPRLWWQPLDSTAARLLPGTDDASFPFWSPDGQSVAFFANGLLSRMSLDDARPTTICAAESGEGGSWGSDGEVFFSPTARGGIWRVSATGGAPVQVTTPADGEAHRWPFLLPGGRKLLYLALSQGGRGVARMRSLDTGAEVEVTEALSRVMAASGRLLFQRGGQLWAQPFDQDTGTLRGEAQRLAEDVAWAAQNGRAGFHVSESGVLVLRVGSGGIPMTRLVWRDRSGAELGTVGTPDRYSSLALSPSGDRLVVTVAQPSQDTSNVGADLWMFDLVRGGLRTRFTAEPGVETNPLWTPDGSRVAYGAGAVFGADLTLWMRGSGGAASPRQIGVVRTGSPTSWSPDRQSLVVNSTAEAFDVSLVPLSGEPPTPLLDSQVIESNAAFSPDGFLLAYQSNEASSSDVYVRPWPFTGEQWRLSTGGGRQPKWNPKGGELYYLSPQNELMVVTASRAGRSWTFRAPIRLFGDAIIDTAATSSTSYVPAPDGQRFLTVAPAAAELTNQASPLIVTINWQSLLKD
jgi:serine/threonine protein kinase